MASPTTGAPVLLEGTGASDDVEVRRLIEVLLGQAFDTQELALPRNYSGDVAFEARLRFTGGALRTVDFSLQKRRHLVYGER